MKIYCDSYFNQFPARVKVSSMIETEPMVLDLTGGEEFYPKYPKIRQKDIGSDTSNKFIDTLNLSNLLLAGIGGRPINLLPLNLSNCWKLLRAS